MIIKEDVNRLLLVEPGSQTPAVVSRPSFGQRYLGQVLQFARAETPISDEDSDTAKPTIFGFRWFIPERLKHKTIWRDVLLASLLLQLLGLATPLFTQTIIDKVVVHQTFSTLTVIGVALSVCTAFCALMSWVRQYLILHTGNRVHAVLGTNAPPEPYALIPARASQGPGWVEFRDLAFRYDAHRPYLYRALNRTLEPGQCVALLGASGSGKSTLAKLLLGFYLPSDGQILLDGRDIRYLSANELRRTFGVVPQETILFSGSIYANLLIADPHARFEQVITACTMAEIHEVIEQLPKRPKMLIFDAATRRLDTSTAEQLAKTINALKGTISALFITHRLPKGLLVDEVVRLGGPGEESHMSVVAIDRNPCPRNEDRYD